MFCCCASPLRVRQQDTQICPAARVFYVAFKWVQDNWPNNLAAPDNHITSHPIRFYVDGHDTEVELTAKLRLYRKAVHLVICELCCCCRHVGCLL